MDAEIEELEKSGAKEIAAKLRESWAKEKAQVDTLRAEHSGAAKKLSAAEKDLAKYKADLEAAGKGTDERVTKLAKEAADAKALADQRTAELESYRLRTELGDRLGLPSTGDAERDAKVRKRALDTFLAEYRPEGAGFDEQGKLVGFEKALEAFKKAESAVFYVGADAGHGGVRAGSDPSAKPPAAKKAPADKVSAWAERLYPPAPAAKK